MKRTPRRVSRRTVAILASAIIATVLVAIAFVLTKPRWVGEGDWAACAEIATVRPAEAAETAARQEGVDLWSYRAHVRPAFVNATGWVFPVTCSQGMAVVDPHGSQLPESYRGGDGREHFTWAVSLGKEWELCGGPPMYIDWETGHPVFTPEPLRC